MVTYDNELLFVTFRGCQDAKEVLNCIETKVVQPFITKPIKISSPIWDRFDMEKESIESIVKDYVHNYKVSDIIFTGHSLGGALAQLTGNFCDFPSTNKHCITFGAPYVGDIAFKRDIENNINDIQRVVIKRDIVPQIKFNKVLVHNGRDRIYNFKSKAPFPINLYENHKSINYLKCIKGTH